MVSPAATASPSRCGLWQLYPALGNTSPSSCFKELRHIILMGAYWRASPVLVSSPCAGAVAASRSTLMPNAAEFVPADRRQRSGGRGEDAAAVQRLLGARRLPTPLARGCRVREAGRGGGGAPHGGGRAGPAGRASAGPGEAPSAAAPAAGRGRRRPGPRARRPPPPGAAAAPPRPHYLRGAAAGAPAPLRAGGGGSVVRPVLPLRPLAGPALRGWAAPAGSAAGSGGAGTPSPNPGARGQVRHLPIRARKRNAPLARPRREPGFAMWSVGARRLPSGSWIAGTTAWHAGGMRCGPGKSAPSPPDRKVTRVTRCGECCPEAFVRAPSPIKSHAFLSPTVRVKPEARLC